MTSPSYRRLTGTAAQNYEQYFVPAIATPVSGDLLEAADLKQGEHVLDVACGTGLIARLAAGRVGPGGGVTGIDLSPDMIEVARSIDVADGAPIRWHVGDAAALPFNDDDYDVILCQMGLMFMEDRPAALAEMRRVLRPGGRIVINTPGAMQPVLQIMEQALAQHINPQLGGFVRAVFSMPDPEPLAALLRDAGLSDVWSKVVVTTLHLPPPAEFLWGYISVTPMAPIVAQAPEEAQAAMERQVVERSEPYMVDGRTRVEQPMVLAGGRK